jgi:hypothetical protein
MTDTADRQTGRTTAMLQQAVLRKTSNGGTRILIVVHSGRMISYCRAIAPSLERRDFITINGVPTVSFERQAYSVGRENVFVDHTVWEVIDGRTAAMLDRVLS